MVKLKGNELILDNDTFYDLSKISITRVVQGLNFQLNEGSLTKNDYEQCINLLEVYEQKEIALKLLKDSEGILVIRATSILNLCVKAKPIEIFCTADIEKISTDLKSSLDRFASSL